MKFCTIISFFPGQVNTYSEKHKRKREGAQVRLPLTFSFLGSFCLHVDDLAAIVVPASLAGSVGQAKLTALGAGGNAGSGQLPVGTAPLVASRLGHFTLGDSHE